MYRSEAGDLVLAATGDSLITRRLAVYDEPAFRKLFEVIRGADAAFTNLEMLFHDYAATRRELGTRGMVYAGAGDNLAEARGPSYLETPAGRIALLAASSSFAPPGLAGAQREDVGREA